LKMSWIDAMLSLQEADDRCRRLATRLGVIPGELLKLKQRAADNRAAQKAAEQEILRDRQNIKKAENDIHSLQEEEDRLRSQSAMVKKNAEYQSMLVQVAGLQKKAGVLETFILETMDAIEVKEKTLRELVSANNAANASLKAEFGELQTLAADLKQEIAKGKEEAAKRRNDVPADLLSRYDALLAKNDGVLPLVPVVSGVCGGCHMKVTAQTMATMTRGGVAYCDNCMRFVYLPEEA